MIKCQTSKIGQNMNCTTFRHLQASIPTSTCNIQHNKNIKIIMNIKLPKKHVINKFNSQPIQASVGVSTEAATQLASQEKMQLEFGALDASDSKT